MIIQVKFRLSRKEATEILAADLFEGHRPPKNLDQLKETLRWYLTKHGASTKTVNFSSSERSMERAKIFINNVWPI